MKKHNNYIYFVVLGLFFAFPLFINAENPTPGTTIVNDDFNDGNDNGWTRVRGEWRVDKWPPDVEDWQYYVSTGEKSISVRNDVYCGNCVVDFEVAPNEGSVRMGVVFNYQDENNFYFYWFDYSQGVGISKYVNGARTDIAGVTQVSSVWNVKQRLEISEKTIKAYSDGIEVLRYENDSLMQGKVGLMSEGDGGNFDDFAVYDYKVCHWSCGEWSMCRDNTQTRVCTETNSCGTFDDKPEEKRNCDYCYDDRKETNVNVNDRNNKHNASVVAVDEQGNSVVAWGMANVDDGGRTIWSDAMVKRYDVQGNPIGAEFRVNSPLSNTAQKLAVSINSNGNFIVAWQGNLETGQQGIYAQIFDKSSNKIGDQLTVYTQAVYKGGNYVYGPLVYSDRLGNFNIFWSESGDIQGLFTQKYQSDGSKIGGKILLSSQPSVDQTAVAFTSRGDYIVAWVGVDDAAKSSPGIFAQRFNSAGSKLGGMFRVNNTIVGSQISPAVTADTQDNYIVAWIDFQPDANGDIPFFANAPVMVQRFDKDGREIGTEAVLYQSTFLMEDNYPLIKSDRSDNILVSWVNIEGTWGGWKESIQASYFDKNWQKLGGPTIINHQISPSSSYYPYVDMGMNLNGDAVYTWFDTSSQDDRIRMYSTKNFYNIGINKEFLVATSVDQSFNLKTYNTAIDAEGNFVATWVHQDPNSSNYPSIIFAQRFDRFGNKLGEIFRVNSSIGYYLYPPSIAMDPNGNFTIIWNTGYCSVPNGCHAEILGQRFDNLGNKIGGEFQISATDNGSYNHPVIGLDESGNFVVSWRERKPNQPDNIVAQRFGGNGEKIGNEFQVNTANLGYEDAPALAMDKDGNFVVAWSGLSDNPRICCFDSILVQRFDKNGNKLGNEFRANILDEYQHSHPSIAMDGGGNFIVSWTVGQYAILAQRFNANGNKIGDVIDVFPNGTLRTGSTDYSEVVVDSMGNFLITEGNLFAQRFDRSSTRMGSVYFLDSTILHSEGSSVAMNAQGDYVAIWRGAVESDPLLNAGLYARIFRKDCSVTCSNGVKDLVEVDVDCGGQCGKCAQEKGCNSAIDCQSNYCNPNNVCAVPSCSDGWKNGNETGVDCGETCPACPCTENWSCGVWPECANSLQTRTCTDLNHCGTISSRPIVVQGCDSCHNNKFDEQVEEGVDCGDVCGNDCINPVIVVPGMLGSWYKDDVFVIDPILNTYDKLISNLETYAKYELNKTLFPFPYDWRNSNTSTAQLLKNKIGEIKKNNNLRVSKTKVDIVAHSMGGMVARYYIESNLFQNDINNLIFISSPQLGSTVAYLAWEGGDTYNFKVNYLLNKLAKSEKYKNRYEYVHNRPISSLYEMLPTYNYLVNKGAIQPRIYPENYPRNEFIEFLNRQDKLDYLYNKSQVKLYNIYGFIDNSTIDSLKVEDRKPEQAPMWEHGYPLNFPSKDGLIYQAGDGSLSFRSVSAIISKDTIILPQEHLEIVSYASSDIIKILTGKQYDITIPKLPNKYLSIEAHSPINFYILDPLSRKLGFDFMRGGEVNEILGAFYSGKDSDLEFIFISDPLEGEYKIYGLGTAAGSYEFQSDYFDDNVVTTKIIVDKTEINKQDGFTFNLDYQDSEVISDFSENLFLRGDSNQDNTVDISDAIFTLSYLFTNPNLLLRCQDAADANDDGKIDISDAIFTLNFLFTNNNLEFPKPYPSQGPDQTDDGFGCAKL